MGRKLKLFLSSYLSSWWNFSGHQDKLAHELQISAPIKKGRKTYLISFYRVIKMLQVVEQFSSACAVTVPGSPAGRTCAATPGWPRWPGPVWRPGSEAGSACSVCSRPPDGCRLSGLRWSQECLCLPASARPPAGAKRQREFTSFLTCLEPHFYMF